MKLHYARDTVSAVREFSGMGDPPSRAVSKALRTCEVYRLWPFGL